MPVVLRILSGALSAQTALETGKTLSIGNGEGAGLVVPDPGMAPLHLLLQGGDHNCRVRDVNSPGGTRLDGQAISEASAYHGSVIEAAGTTIEVRIEPRAPLGLEALAVQRSTWRAAGPRGERIRAYARLLRAQPQPLFALLDAARDPRVLALIQGSGAEYWSLYPGEHAARLAKAAPYLVRLEAGSPLLDTLLLEGFGESFGVYLLSRKPVERILLNLQYLLLIQDEDGRTRYFRYYDPRVLRVFLPVCTPQQADLFFATIEGFFGEGERGKSLLWFGRK
jgi:pSer/pThr/pTyr-binding forkhead associated (FHA) protein